MCLLQNNQSEPFSKMNIFTYKIPFLFKTLVVEYVTTFFINIFIEIAVKIFTKNKAIIAWREDKSTISSKIQVKKSLKSPLTLCKQEIHIFFRIASPFLRSISQWIFHIVFVYFSAWVLSTIWLIWIITKRSRKSSIMCQSLPNYFVVAAGMIGLCKRFCFLNLIWRLQNCLGC